MALIKTVRGFSPRWGKDCYIAENATIVGDVTMGDACSVWFNAVIRGDVNSITIGNKTNIQDGVVIHGTYQKSGTIIGNEVSIGHNASIHGCTLHDSVLIGMNAVVIDGAVVESHSIVAAGAVVLANMVVESGYIYAGVPAKKIKKIEGELAQVFARTANNYPMYAKWFDDSTVR